MACTLVDIEAAMLALSRRLNPECEHISADMRSLSLGRVFDCVLIHDAISYMTSSEDLSRAVCTAFTHTAPGGVALFQPDFVTETFSPGTETGGSDTKGRALRYIEWRWTPDLRSDIYITDMAYLLRDDTGSVGVVSDRHVMGLFPRDLWMQLIEAAGFKPLAIPFEHSSYSKTGFEVFLGLKSATDGEL